MSHCNNRASSRVFGLTVGEIVICWVCLCGCGISRLSAVRFGAGSGTLCLNLNPHLWVRSSPLPNLNPEVRVQFRCEPGAPEVQTLIWAKYGNRSPNIFPSGYLNLWFRCGFSQNSHFPAPEPEPQVRFGFAPGPGGSRTGPQTV
jgi:hypothetical protein